MGEKRLIGGWGRTPQTTSEITSLESDDEARLTDAKRGHLARGLGRSYGDAALNSGGVVFKTTALSSLTFDEHLGVVHTGAGVSYLDLIRASVPRGLFPPVTPGTKFVTIGGAIAADVHGKNHHRDGSVGRHIESITMLTGNDEVVETRRGEGLFAATIGGMGLTGVILSATIRMFRVSSPQLQVDTIKTRDFGETLDVMEKGDQLHRYSVAWVDLANTKARGRSVITMGDHAGVGDLTRWKPARPRIDVPDLFPSSTINRASVIAFNELWYRKAPPERHAELQSIDTFFYPLDLANNWNRVYGTRGFIQYQMVIPFGREDVFEEAVALLGSAAVPPSLVVLKRLGEGNGLLSFPIAGWTIAVDYPASRGDLAHVLDRVDELVANAGGRVYLAKDSRLDPALLARMYPELDRWRDLADKADPTRRFRSDLDRRLRLRDAT